MNKKNISPIKRIEQITKHLNISIDVFGQKISGHERGSQALYDIMSGKTKSITPKMKNKILAKYPQFNEVWLLTGSGTMLISSTKGIKQGNEDTSTSTEHYNAPLLPVSAMGGSLNEFSKGVMRYDVEQIISPIKGVDFVIRVSGDSMYPDYPNGCKVFIKKVNENLFLQWGEVYVLDTQNGVIIKRIKKSEKEGCIICESNDHNYTPFELEIAQVHGFYKILLMMIAK